MIHYEDFEREKLDPVYEIIAPYSEMDKEQRYFLNGMIRFLKPRKILEAGVSSGGGSALILNAISDIDGAKLYSEDYLEKTYRYPDKPSGFLVDEKFSELKHKWQIYRGGDVSRYIESIGGDIDMLVLDTMHIHPWETLNFLCIMPFMKKESWTVLHDISLFALPHARSSLACRYLFGHVVSDEKITLKSGKFPNIGAFKVSDVTKKYIDNLFQSLVIPWSSRVSENDISDIKKIIMKYYSDEQYKFFCDIIEFQEHIFKNPESFRSIIKNAIRERISPNLFSFMQKIRYLRK